MLQSSASTCVLCSAVCSGRSTDAIAYIVMIGSRGNLNDSTCKLSDSDSGVIERSGATSVNNHGCSNGISWPIAAVFRSF